MNVSFQPYPATLVAIESLHNDVRVFTFDHQQAMTVQPGQFAEIILPGIGGFPVSACGYVTAGTFQACIRRAGRVTSALFRCTIGDCVGVRGPFGNGFHLPDLARKDVLLIAGGLGIAPIRALLQSVVGGAARSVTLFYGARRAAELLFLPELEALAERGSLCLRLAVEEPLEAICSPQRWHSGPVTDLVDALPSSTATLLVAVCGPPQMYAVLLEKLATTGITAAHIFATLERRMRCGVGECGHCVAGGHYVCTEGPVFSLAQLRQMPGAIA
jgi:NAD(P)H-flavin reductase